MATKKSGSKRLASKKRVASAGSARSDRLVALTVKVDHDVYVRLCTLGAIHRKTNQDILEQSLREFLDRAKG